MEKSLAIRPILQYPHVALRRRARKIRKIDKSVQSLADDLVDTLLDAGGVGLAANQVGVLRRIIVIQLPDEENPRVYVNPEIVHKEGKREVEEGCLSIPGYHATIFRSVFIRAIGLDLQSKFLKLDAEGLLAQVLEHEIDHLNGIMYIDHLESHQQLIKNELEPESTNSQILSTV